MIMISLFLHFETEHLYSHLHFQKDKHHSIHPIIQTGSCNLHSRLNFKLLVKCKLSRKGSHANRSSACDVLHATEYSECYSWKSVMYNLLF